MNRHTRLKIAVAYRGDTFDSLAEQLGYAKIQIYRWANEKPTPAALARQLIDYANLALSEIKGIAPLPRLLTPFDIGYELPAKTATKQRKPSRK